MRGAGLGIATTAARVLIRSTSDGIGSPSTVAAPFGMSMYDALNQGLHSSKERDTIGWWSSTPSHFDRMMVRMEEIFDDKHGAAVIFAPDSSSANDNFTTANAAANDTKEWSLPLARAATNPSLLSTSCPTVTLAQHNWYETNQPRKENVHLGVVAAVSDPEGRILLTRRAEHMRSFPSAWVMPGGGLDDGESISTALVREVAEETGVVVDAKSIVPFCLWESCYPTCGGKCIEAGTGITAHYLVVFCLAQTLERDLASVRKQVRLDETETDRAVWLSAEDFVQTLQYPLGGAGIGTVHIASSDDGSMALEDLCGIYPRGEDGKGIAQGNLFMLQELLHSKKWINEPKTSSHLSNL